MSFNLTAYKVTDIDLQAAKDYLRIDFVEDDIFLTAALESAKAFVQTILGKSFSDWTYETLPTEFTIAVFLLTAHFYETRVISSEPSKEIAYSISAILNAHKVYVLDETL